MSWRTARPSGRTPSAGSRPPVSCQGSILDSDDDGGGDRGKRPRQGSHSKLNRQKEAAMARVPSLGSTRTGRVPADPSNKGASPAGLQALQRAQGGWPAPKPILLRKTADEVVNNSDVLQDDDHLRVQLDTGTYVVDGVLIYDASTAADVKLKWDGGS